MEADRKAFEKTPAGLEENRKGWHCLSGAVGSKRRRHDDVVYHIKSNMRDPDSFEFEGTIVEPDIGGYHTGVMKYKGRNALGGMVIGTVEFIYSNADCSATILSVKEG